MEKGLQTTQAYPWICRGFLRTIDPQEIGADRGKNRSVWVKIGQFKGGARGHIGAVKTGSVNGIAD